MGFKLRKEERRTRGVEGSKDERDQWNLQVAVEFKDCLNPDILITPILRMKELLLRG